MLNTYLHQIGLMTRLQINYLVGLKSILCAVHNSLSGCITRLRINYLVGLKSILCAMRNSLSDCITHLQINYLVGLRIILCAMRNGLSDCIAHLKVNYFVDLKNNLRIVAGNLTVAAITMFYVSITTQSIFGTLEGVAKTFSEFAAGIITAYVLAFIAPIVLSVRPESSGRFADSNDGFKALTLMPLVCLVAMSAWGWLATGSFGLADGNIVDNTADLLTLFAEVILLSLAG